MSAYDDFRREQEAKLALLTKTADKSNRKKKDTLTKTSVIVDVVAKQLGWKRDIPDSTDKQWRTSRIKPWLIERGVLVINPARQRNQFICSRSSLILAVKAFQRHMEIEKTPIPPPGAKLRCGDKGRIKQAAKEAEKQRILAIYRERYRQQDL